MDTELGDEDRSTCSSTGVAELEIEQGVEMGTDWVRCAASSLGNLPADKVMNISRRFVEVKVLMGLEGSLTALGETVLVLPSAQKCLKWFHIENTARWRK